MLGDDRRSGIEEIVLVLRPEAGTRTRTRIRVGAREPRCPAHSVSIVSHSSPQHPIEYEYRFAEYEHEHEHERRIGDIELDDCHFDWTARFAWLDRRK